MAKKQSNANADKVSNAIEKNREAIRASGLTLNDAQIRAIIDIVKAAI